MIDVVLLSAVRTPIGSFMGALESLPAPRLGAAAIGGAIAKAELEPTAVEQVIMGNVLQAGIGQAPARQAAIYAGLPMSTGAITLHKVCGSGMRAVMDGANAIRAGEWKVVVAGGMESMSNAPHLLQRSRAGYRLGDVKVVDSMVKDGLWDPYDDKHMGMCAETCVKKYGFSRAAQDEFAYDSYQKARTAVESGTFEPELVPVQVPQRKGDPVVVNRDEEPFKSSLEKMGKLRPAFDASGSVTAANASTLNDGAAALVLAASSEAKRLGKRPLARLMAQASVAQEPEWFTTAPALAIRKVLERAELGKADISRWEINEAFSAVAMAAIHDLELDPSTVNVRGGAVALGHPIGCSGARILTTLLHTLLQEKLRYGCAAICIGGGESTAVIVENLTL